jgi:hypothetical protein
MVTGVGEVFKKQRFSKGKGFVKAGRSKQVW